MKGLNRHGNQVACAALCMAVLQLFVWLPNSFSETPKPSLSPEETFRLGERMYLEGILPSGEPMKAFVKGDLPVLGTVVTCVSCHQRSGLGSFEGGVYTPATNGPKLYKPSQTLPDRLTKERDPQNFPLTHHRDAYTDATLAEALRSGVDPAGRIFNDAMPRYMLEDGDMAIMISYLKSLSSHYSPGISGTNVSFATVITDDVSQEDRDAMLVSLFGFIGSRSKQALILKQLSGVAQKNFVIMGGDMMNALRQSMTLTPWLLKGPPETWRSQLEEYYRKEPVFALIGGISTGDWKPIHQFSEDNRIPCLFPNTDFPVISRTGFYTLYLSKGYYQEGEAAARYLNNRGEVLKGRPIVQIVRDSREGKALSAGFQETWRDLGHGAVVTLTLKPGEELTKKVVQQVLAKNKPAAVVLWDGSAALAELETVAMGDNRPEMVFVSSSYLGKGLWSMKEQVRDFTYITYPFRLQNWVDPSNHTHTYPIDTTKKAVQEYALSQVLTMALMDMEKNYYRDYFLDVIGMIGDLDVPLYEHLSFGPGQRYASKGCYIVQLSRGDKPAFIRKSDWVIH